MFQQLVLWATVGLLLDAVGYTWNTWQFWSFLGTYWAVAQLSKYQGKIEGIIGYLDMTEQDQQRVKRALREAREETK